MKKIILCKMRFNPCKIILNMGQLEKLETWNSENFPEVQFNLTSRGLDLISHKLLNESHSFQFRCCYLQYFSAWQCSSCMITVDMGVNRHTQYATASTD